MVDPADYRPTVADLGALLRSRTLDDEGNELGTFTAATRPTADQAEDFITRSLALVTPRLGVVPDRLADMAGAIVALRAGMMVERSLFTQEATPDQSAYQTLRDEYRDALADYDSALGEATPVTRAKAASVSQSYLNPSGE